MRILPLLLILPLAACAADDPLDAPGGGGGGGGNMMGAIDGGQFPPSDGGLVEFTAQLCHVTDLRSPTNCSALTNLSGVDIEDALTGLSTVADAEGFFTLPVSENASVIQLRVGYEDPIYRDVLVPLAAGLTGIRVPIVSEDTWESLTLTVGLLEPDGTASIVTYIVDGGAPVSGAEVIPPEGSAAPIYDGPANANDWQSGGLTGTAGAAIMTAVPALLPEVSFSVSAAAELQVVEAVPVEDGVLTFVTYELQ